ATTVGNLAMFAGGSVGNSSTANVDIYNDSTGQWSTASLSQARMGLAATSLGHLAFFAGGQTAPTGPYSDVVDIYDASTNQWSTTTLSQARTGIAATTLGDLAIF